MGTCRRCCCLLLNRWLLLLNPASVMVPASVLLLSLLILLLSLHAQAGKGGPRELVVEIGGPQPEPLLGGKGGKGIGGKGKFLRLMKDQTKNQEDGLQQHERQLEQKESKIEAKEKPIEKTLEGAGKSKSDADRLLRKEKK